MWLPNVLDPFETLSSYLDCLSACPSLRHSGLLTHICWYSSTLATFTSRCRVITWPWISSCWLYLDEMTASIWVLPSCTCRLALWPPTWFMLSDLSNIFFTSSKRVKDHSAQRQDSSYGSGQNLATGHPQSGIVLGENVFSEHTWAPPESYQTLRTHSWLQTHQPELDCMTFL